MNGYRIPRSIHDIHTFIFKNFKEIKYILILSEFQFLKKNL
jgi:hypothetical protein